MLLCGPGVFARSVSCCGEGIDTGCFSLKELLSFKGWQFDGVGWEGPPRHSCARMIDRPALTVTAVIPGGVAMKQDFGHREGFFWGFIIFSSLLVGCATLEKPVDLTYSHAVTAGGGSGEAYLAMPVIEPHLLKMPRGRTVLGTVKGTATQIVTSDDVSQWIIGALTDELHSAGYEIRTVPRLPPGVPQGVSVRVVKLSADQATDGLLLTTSTDISLAAEVWKQGVLVKTLTAEAARQDQGLDRSGTFVGATLQETLQSAMEQLVPDIIGALAPAKTPR